MREYFITEVPASPRDEALFHCGKPSGVPRGPANSTASLTYQRHPGKFPKVPGRKQTMVELRPVRQQSGFREGLRACYWEGPSELPERRSSSSAPRRDSTEPRPAGDLGLIPGLGRSPGGGHDSPLQYSCLEDPTDGGAWWAAVHGVTKSQTRLSDLAAAAAEAA